MPILGEDDVPEERGEPKDGLDDSIAIGDREGAAGAEVILNVDNDENVSCGYLEHAAPGVRQE